MRIRSRKLHLLLTFTACLTAAISVAANAENKPAENKPQNFQGKEITADHSLFKELQRDFTSGDEVTQACSGCHNRASAQVKSTLHWNWESHFDHNLGKGGRSLNNYCISSNKLGDNACVNCHVGWDGKKGEVNCLVCHSQKITNWKESFADVAEFVADGDEESLEIAEEIRQELRASYQAIGTPTAKNCGSCHFYSGGGDGVKRGDMDSSLVNPSRDLDVHLSKDGAGFTCVDCHETTNHHVPGRQYSHSAKEMRENEPHRKTKSPLNCETCHSDRPHKENSLLDSHAKKIACQTCHIPSIARGHPTKVWWDWSKAGKTKDGKPYYTTDDLGMKNYMSIKGEFKWEKNVRPVYQWYNGAMKNITLDDKIDPNSVVEVQVPLAYDPKKGSRRHQGFKIHPFKEHLGNQPYDTERQALLAPMLSGDKGYWTTLNWEESLTEGMKIMGIPFSGKYDFVKSKFLYSSNHTIAPKEQALTCDECHNRSDSRMNGIAGVYVPGRGDFSVFTKWVWVLMGLMVVGAVFHALFRIIIKVRSRED